MARLIVKSPYVKGGARGGAPGGYLKYIGTREGVELLPSGFMEYMAERPRSHGLFGDEDAVDMNAAMKELNEYPGNIWTHVISLKREDAERLGYQTWREFQCRVEEFYSEKERQRPSLSQQKEFRSIKNAIIREADALRLGQFTFEDEGMDESVEFQDLPSSCVELWMVAQDDTAVMEERDEAAA